MQAGTKIDVELLGGPLDGHRTEVTMKKPGFDVWLFRRQESGSPEVLAYVLSGTTTEGGKLWVLRYLYEVAKQGAANIELRASDVEHRREEKEEGGAA
jgi:hypothetical protein